MRARKLIEQRDQPQQQLVARPHCLGYRRRHHSTPPPLKDDRCPVELEAKGQRTKSKGLWLNVLNETKPKSAEPVDGGESVSVRHTQALLPVTRIIGPGTATDHTL